MTVNRTGALAAARLSLFVQTVYTLQSSASLGGAALCAAPSCIVSVCDCAGCRELSQGLLMLCVEPCISVPTQSPFLSFTAGSFLHPNTAPPPHHQKWYSTRMKSATYTEEDGWRCGYYIITAFPWFRNLNKTTEDHYMWVWQISQSDVSLTTVKGNVCTGNVSFFISKVHTIVSSFLISSPRLLARLTTSSYQL